MKKTYIITCLLVSCAVLYNCSVSKNTAMNQAAISNPYPTRSFNPKPSLDYLSPQQSMKTFNMP
ncbi:MAG: hypothetical protein INR73_20890, partial [Williamsia sp.]|nr:hypothetical protein [Williamsia sp.]